MLTKLTRLGKAILAGLLNVPRAIRANRVLLLKSGLKVATVAFIVFAYAMLTSSSSYRISEGELTYKLNPSWYGGYIELPLGPAGMASFKTHKPPINIRMDLVLRKDLMDGQNASDAWGNGVTNFKLDAVDAFYHFLTWRFVWIILIGVGVGVVVTNGGKHWFLRLARNMAIWAGVFVIVTATYAGISYRSFDRTPDPKYTGISEVFPKFINLFMKVGSDYKFGKNIFQNFVDGITYVSYQIDQKPYSGTNDSQTRILCFGDVHDNPIPIKIASDLLNGKSPEDIDAVIMTGDMTDVGTSFEASTFVSRIRTKKPVWLVGGNHEDSGAMTTFQEMGYTILNGVPVQFGGLDILGLSDPLAESPDIDSDVEGLQTLSEDMTSWWNNYTTKPQVIVVHDISQAKGIIEEAKKQNVNLTVVFGHDHKTSVTQDGCVTLVGCGTSGASGFDGAGRDPYAPNEFQILHFSQGSNPCLIMVTTLSYIGKSDTLVATYKSIK
ncbi:MAG: metallophosphoesterase [Patescibacteria group bacterium]